MVSLIGMGATVIEDVKAILAELGHPESAHSGVHLHAIRRWNKEPSSGETHVLYDCRVRHKATGKTQHARVLFGVFDSEFVAYPNKRELICGRSRNAINELERIADEHEEDIV